MAFARRNESGYTRLGKMDFQHPVRTAKRSFWVVNSLEIVTVHREVAFTFRSFFPKRKALADIHSNVGLVHLLNDLTKYFDYNKPVITWPYQALS